VTRLIAAAPQFDEPTWRRELRHTALARFESIGLPDTDDDVWRYAPLHRLVLDELELATVPPPGADEVGWRADASAAALVEAGALVGARTTTDGVVVTSSPPQDVLGRLVGPDDAFAALNLAHTPGPVVVGVDAGAAPDGPVVLDVRCPAGASFPRVLVRVGEGARLRVLERVTGADATFVAGVAEYEVAEGASLEVCTVQSLGAEAWSLARTRASLARAATFTQTVVGLGGRYDRVRADALLDGDDATSVLMTAHVGTGAQVHDLRTMQVHTGRRTTSRLRSKAAVAGAAGSVYSGLIRMRHGARRADASQVNTSLVLSDDAHADAVPNLDIEENDVRCTHASSVGPVDAEQRWYLESRGVTPADAVQLILEGFFDDVARQLADDALAAELRVAIARLDPTAIALASGGTA
jgi:Fe-S cluster assembly protein SufD